MTDRPQPVFRTAEEVLLIGTMAIYNSQAEASESIPEQWREFRLTYSALGSNSKFYGASPCTDDRKIHYLTGIAQESPEVLVRGERLTGGRVCGRACRRCSPPSRHLDLVAGQLAA